MSISKPKLSLWRHVYVLLGFLCFALEIVLNPQNPLLSGFFMILVTAALYFWVVLLVADRNWLDIRAIFTATWMGTIGLAALRLTGYQEQWQSMTWVNMGLAYVMFQVGSDLGIHYGKKWHSTLTKSFEKLRIGRLHFSMQPARLFPVCIVVTTIGLVCFVINICIKGFIPCFSDSPFAYVDFYTKFHVFAVAACSVSGLCYYCIRTQPLRLWQKIVLSACILYTVFVFPIMVVSRGVFVVAAVSLTVTVFYLHKKRLLALVLCLAVILGVYWGCSSLRNLTDSQLSTLFEPIHVDLSNKPTEESTNPTDTEESTDPTDNPSEEPGASSSFQLSPKMAFLYGYITVSHDNFNEAVQNATAFTYGVRQFSPFNVILRSSWIEQKNAEAETYFVRPHLNTTNLIGDFYYDFGIIGVVLCTLLWAFVFGINQSAYEVGKHPIVLLLLGNTMVPIVLCFFSTWLSLFNHWLLWGTPLLFAAACCVRLHPKKK